FSYSHVFVFSPLIPPHTTLSLLPYTTLFRSHPAKRPIPKCIFFRPSLALWAHYRRWRHTAFSSWGFSPRRMERRFAVGQSAAVRREVQHSLNQPVIAQAGCPGSLREAGVILRVRQDTGERIQF